MTKIPISGINRNDLKEILAAVNIPDPKSVEVEYRHDIGLVIAMTFENRHRNDKDFCVLLDPQSATQLANHLRRAVEDCLNYSSETE